MKRFKSAHPVAERWGSLGLAVFFHASLLLVLIYAAAPSPLKLRDMPMIDLRQVTIGSSGPREPGKKVEVTADPKPTQAQPEPAPKVENAVPVPKIEELKPEPVAEAKPAPKPEPVPEAKPEPEPEPKPSDEDLLKAAFADAARTAKPAPKVSGGQSIVDQALSEALADSKKAGAGGIITGADGDGVGYLGSYRDSVISRIRPHLTTPPRSDGKVFEVTVVMEIADDGTVTNVVVTKASGDGTFDSNVLRAIREAGKMEPPMNNDVRKLTVLFNSNMSGG